MPSSKFLKDFFRTAMLLGLIKCWCLTGLLHGQQVNTALSETKVVDSFVSISGMVTERKKYTITVDDHGKRWSVRLARGAPVALQLDLPWFDWENRRVVVEAVATDDPLSATQPSRVAYDFPAETLFVISRFESPELLREFLQDQERRLSFYLVTPDDVGRHFPNEQELFLAGQLTPDGKQNGVAVQFENQALKAKLGFRKGAMNGFSIVNLRPQTTFVTLSGTTTANGEIVAERVVFYPLRKRTD